jgi:hypothetical protein
MLAFILYSLKWGSREPEWFLQLISDWVATACNDSFKRASLKCVSLEAETTRAPATAIRSIKNLEELTLNQMTLQEPLVNSIVEMVRRCPSLQVLRLIASNSPSFVTVHLPIELLNALPSTLHTLEVGSNLLLFASDLPSSLTQLRADERARLCDHFWQTLQRKKVHFKRLHLSCEVSQGFFDYLRSYNGLQELTISCLRGHGRHSPHTFIADILPHHLKTLQVYKVDKIMHNAYWWQPTPCKKHRDILASSSLVELFVLLPYCQLEDLDVSLTWFVVSTYSRLLVRIMLNFISC